MAQPAFFVESKMQFRESEHARRCSGDTPAPPLIVIPTFILGDSERRGTVIVVRHSAAP
jgi:hypothetical protein